MKKMFSTLLLIILTSNIHSQQTDPWKWSHPKPVGNALRWVKAWDSQNWYIAGNAGTFMKTSNAGATWEVTQFINGFTDIGNNTTVYDGHFFNQNTGYIVGGLGRVCKTTDAGATWNTVVAVSEGLTYYGMHWLNEQVGLLAGTTTGRVAKTTNGGQSWFQYGSIPAGTYYSVHAFSETSAIVTSTVGNVRKTTDNGNTWTTINTGETSTLWGMRFLNDSLGLVAGSSRRVAITTNAGDSWTQVSFNLPNITYYDIQYFSTGIGYQNTFVYLTGNQNAVYRADVASLLNGTAIWEELEFLSPQQTITDAYYSTSLINADTLITVGNRGLINVRYGSANKVSLTEIISDGSHQAIWADNQGRVIACGNSSSGGGKQIMYSTNSGNSWNLSTMQDNNVAVIRDLAMINSATGWAINSSGRVYKTLNSGVSWDTLPVVSNLNFEDIFFINENTGYCFGNSGNGFKTTNGGSNWFAVVTGTTQGLRSSHFFNSDTGFVVGVGTTVIKTTNGGSSFTPVNAGFPTSALYAVCFSDANNGWIVGASGRVRRTTDGGNTWLLADVPLATGLFSVHFLDAQNGVVGGSGGSVFTTSDGGQTWNTFNHGASTTNGVRMIHVDTIYAASLMASVLKYEDIATGIFTFENSAPESFELYQNFPNPFNPSTTIKFALKKTSLVSLNIYDVSGREVSELFSNELLNSGTYSYRFDAASLTSGVYFYCLKVGGETIGVNKMVYLK